MVTEFSIEAAMRSEDGKEQHTVYRIKRINYWSAYNHLLQLVQDMKCKLVRHKIQIVGEVTSPPLSPMDQLRALPPPPPKEQIVRPATVTTPPAVYTPPPQEPKPRGWWDDITAVTKSHVPVLTVDKEWRQNA